MSSNNMARNFDIKGGDPANLPAHIVEVAGLRDEVIAWTYFDPAYYGKISPIVRRNTCLFLLCPHLLPLYLPCIFWECVVDETKARSTHWILTKQELKIVILDYSVCCCTSGVEVKTIPLESISTVASYTRCGSVPSTVVTIAGTEPIHRRLIGSFGLMDHEWFIQEVLNARDASKGGVAEAVACNDGVCSQSMERDDNPTSAQRLRQIIELRDEGLLTCEEYDKKRQEIMSSL
jgi:hypothetical protein